MATKKTKKTEQDERIEESLREIYGDDPQDIGTITKGKSPITRILTRIVLSLAALLIIGGGAFFLYAQFFALEPQAQLSLVFDADENLKSGEKTSITLTYRNEERVPLASLDIDVNLPSDFVLTSSSPEPTINEDLIWSFGSLPAYSDGTITLTGTYIGAVESRSRIQSIATYKPGNFNATFQEVAVADFDPIGSIIEAEVIAPESVATGEMAEYAIKLTNASDILAPPVQISADAPSAFTLAESEPALEPGAPIEWTLGEIGAGESAEITFSGSFSSLAEGFQIFDISAAFQPNGSDKEFEQFSSAFSTDVIPGELKAQLLVNGSSTTFTASKGETLSLTGTIENISKEEIDGITGIIDFRTEDRLPISWSQGDYGDGTLTSAGIVYSIPSLAPGERTLLRAEVPVLADIPEGILTEVDVIARAEEGGVSISSNRITLSFDADLTAQE
jgi:hypothetical protein